MLVLSYTCTQFGSCYFPLVPSFLPKVLGLYAYVVWQTDVNVASCTLADGLLQYYFCSEA